MATSLERSLLDEIYAAPDDDGVRSIYADWLIEQGDPLGHFITLQLARAARIEPVASDEEQRLLDGNWRAWVGEPARILDAKHVAFERGLWSICESFDGAALTDEMLAAPSWATVRQLHVGAELEPQLDRILAVMRGSLRSVSVGSRSVLQQLAAADLQLEELAFAFDTSRDPPPIAGFPRLRRLHVHCLGELAERWLERADAAGLRELSLFTRPHPDELARLVRRLKQTRIAKLSIAVATAMTLHVHHESDGNVAVHSLELAPSRDSPLDAVHQARAWIEGKEALLDRSLKVTLPAFTARVAEYADVLGIKLVRAPRCYPARPGA